MPSDFAFRLSTYLTLFLGCICLGYSEWDYLPEVSGFTGVVGLLVAVAFWFDRTGRELSRESADRVGFAVGLIALIWLGWHYRQADSLMHTLPWPAGGLPFLGPILMLLMAAKLFRPKHVGDWWALHGVGLCSVMLACALCDDEFFVGIAGVYFLVSVWSLTLFFVRRASGYVDPVPTYTHFMALMVRSILAMIHPSLAEVRPPHRPTVAVPFVGVGVPTPTERLGRSHFFRAISWMAVAALVAFPLFFITPRSKGLQWELFKSRIETGLNSDSSLDMGRTGELKINHDPAFEVSVRWLNGKPREDISPNQRWRVAAYTDYHYPRGRWTRGAKPRLYTPPDGIPLTSNRRPSPIPRFPDLGQAAFLLDFELTKKVPSMVIFDPLSFKPGQSTPVVYSTNEGFSNVIQEQDTSLMTYRREGGKLTNYTQIAIHQGDKSGPFPEYIEPGGGDPSESRSSRLRPLLDCNSEALKKWTRELLERMYATGKLPSAVRDRRDVITLLPDMQDHEIVARTFREYLASSRDYTYTLSLKRTDRSSDPIEDFLFKTKSGHCERFAAALALMLRSVGIPSQFVLGFKGSEALGDGRYLVRQEHAHAWVEVLVSEKAKNPGNWPNARDWYWLSLDPTPDIENPVTELEDTLFSASRKQGRRLVAELIVGLNSDTQKKIANAAGEVATTYAWIGGGMIGVFVLGLIGWFVQQRLKRIAIAEQIEKGIDAVPWFTRMVEILQAQGYPRLSSQTPREFALQIETLLREEKVTRGVCEVPREIVEQLYRNRYAGMVMSTEEVTQISERLNNLQAAVEKAPRRMSESRSSVSRRK